MMMFTKAHTVQITNGICALGMSPLRVQRQTAANIRHFVSPQKLSIRSIHTSMSHSKRNTSLAFFTSYERSLLRSQWGSQATRLTRDSFLPFGSCQLCLLPSQDPVACSGGELIDTTASSTRATDTSAPLQPPMKRSKIRSQCHIFCRECIIANLLSQRKELKRIERNSEAHAADAEAVDVAEDEEARQRAVADFEAVQMGLMAKVGGMGNKRAVVAAENRVTGKAEEDVVVAALGKTVRATDGGKADGEGSRKRKFELDEEELLRIATEDRAKARQALSDEKVDYLSPLHTGSCQNSHSN